jgi:hypothetical protein
MDQSGAHDVNTTTESGDEQEYDDMHMRNRPGLGDEFKDRNPIR